MSFTIAVPRMAPLSHGEWAALHRNGIGERQVPVTLDEVKIVAQVKPVKV
jgi:hypothetical protein